MQTQATTQTKTAASSVLNSDRSGILQRKCTECEQHTIGGGSCGKCQKQRSPITVPSIYTPTIQLSPDGNPTQWGYQIAHAVYRGIGI